MPKDYNDLTFTDDFMFCKILQNNKEITKQLVEIILGTQISDIERIEAQHSIEDSFESRGIRMDVYFQDDENNVYDIEMQLRMNDNLPSRTRYYHSLIAVDNLNKGATFSDIKNSYVIFICNFDPFKLSAPVYTARTRLDEFPDVVVDDGAVSVFLNCKSKSKDISPELQAFFKYISKNTASKGLTESIENDLVKAKNQKKWRREYMTLYEIKQIERAEGRAEGRAEALANASVRAIPFMMENGVSLEKACEIMGISVEEYKSLQERMEN